MKLDWSFNVHLFPWTSAADVLPPTTATAASAAAAPAINEN